MGMTTTEQICSTVGDRLSPSTFVLENLEAIPVDGESLQLFQKPLEALKNMLPLLATDVGALTLHIHRQLASLLHHAAETCPLYRTRIPELPSELADPMAVLKALPILRKHDLQTHYTDIWSDAFGAEELNFMHTSGSTGEPTKFIVDHFSIFAREISFWLSLYLRGNGDLAVPQGSVMRVRLSSAEGLAAWYRPMPFENDALLVKFPAFEHSDCDLKPVTDLLADKQPPLLAGDPQALLTLMQYYQKTVSPDARFPYTLKEVTCGGSVLSQDAREQLEAFFQIPINNCYAMSETGLIATECAFGTQHIHAPFNVLEVVDGEGHLLPDGQLGELVVTNLMNFGFPLIRYQTGDMGRLDTRGRCPCGSVLPILYDFQGRKRRFFVKADGTLFSPNALISTVLALDVHQYQIIQDAPDTYCLRYRADAPLAEGPVNDLKTALEKLSGNPVTLHTEHCEQLQEPGIKFQDFISRCHAAELSQFLGLAQNG